MTESPDATMYKEALAEARLKAREIDATMEPTDPRLDGSVLAISEDGSVCLFNRAFVVLHKVNEIEFALIITEYHGRLIHELASLKYLRALGPGLHIERAT